MGHIAPDKEPIQKGGVIISGIRKSIAAASKKGVSRFTTFKLPTRTLLKSTAGPQGTPVVKRPTSTPIPTVTFKSKKARAEQARKEALAQTRQKATANAVEVARLKAQKVRNSTVNRKAAPSISQTRKTQKSAETPEQLQQKKKQWNKVIELIDATAKKKSVIAKAYAVAKLSVLRRLKKIGAQEKTSYKLSLFRNNRAERRIESNLKEARETAILNSKDHGENLEGYLQSKRDTSLADPPKPSAVDGIQRSIGVETAAFTYFSGKRSDAATSLDSGNNAAGRAAKQIDDSALGMNGARNIIGGTDGRGGLLKKHSDLMQSIRDTGASVLKKRNDASDSKVVADKEGGAAGRAKARGEDTSDATAAAAARESHVKMAEGFQQAVGAASLRKKGADDNLQMVQTQRQTSVATGLTDATTRVINTKASMDTSLAGRDGPGGIANKYDNARKKTESEQRAMDNNGVDLKRDQTDKALSARNSAAEKNASDVAEVTTARDRLNNEVVVVEPVLRKNRIDAEKEFGANMPIRSSGDGAAIMRRNKIQEELPTSEAALSAATGIVRRFTDARDVGPASLKTLRKNNDTEAEALRNAVKNEYNPKDAMLKGRKATSEGGAEGPRNILRNLVPDNLAKKGALKLSYQHADEITARINLAKAVGIPARPVDTPDGLATRQGTTSKSGQDNAYSHKQEETTMNSFNQQVKAKETSLASDTALLNAKNGEVEGINTKITEETNAYNAALGKRGDAATSLDSGNRGAVRATTEIDGAALVMKNTRETIGGTDGRGGLLGKHSDLMKSIRDREPGITGLKKGASDSKVIADREGGAAAAARARGEDSTDINSADASRKGAFNDANAHKAGAIDAARRKAAGEEDIVRIDAAAKKEAADIEEAFAATAKAMEDAEAARARADEAGVDLKKLEDEDARNRAAAAAAEKAAADAKREADRLAALADVAKAKADAASALSEKMNAETDAFDSKVGANKGADDANAAAARAAADKAAAARAADDANAAAKRAEDEAIDAANRAKNAEKAAADALAARAATLEGAKKNMADADAAAQAALKQKAEADAAAAAKKEDAEQRVIEANAAVKKAAEDRAAAEKAAADANAAAKKVVDDATEAAEAARMAEKAFAEAKMVAARKNSEKAAADRAAADADAAARAAAANKGMSDADAAARKAKADEDVAKRAAADADAVAKKIGDDAADAAVKADAARRAAEKAAGDADAAAKKAVADKAAADGDAGVANAAARKAAADSEAAAKKAAEDRAAAEKAAADADAVAKKMSDDAADAMAKADAARRAAQKAAADADAAAKKAAAEKGAADADAAARAAAANKGMSDADAAARKAKADEDAAKKAAADADAAAKRAADDAATSSLKADAAKRAADDAAAKAAAAAKKAADEKAAADSDAVAAAGAAKKAADDAEAAARKAVADAEAADRAAKSADAAARRAADEADAAAKRAKAAEDAAKAAADARLAADRAAAAKKRADDAEAEAARIRKELADAELILNEAIRKGTKARADLADAEANLLRLKKEAADIEARRRQAENDRDANEAAIREKEAQKARDQSDIDAADARHRMDEGDMNGGRRDLGDEGVVQQKLKKDEDDAFDEADMHRPREDPDAAAFKKRQKEIEEEIELREAELTRARRAVADAEGGIYIQRNRRHPEDNPDPNIDLDANAQRLRKMRDDEEQRRRALLRQRDDTDENINDNIMRRLMLVALLTTVLNRIFSMIMATPPPPIPVPPVVVWPPPEASGAQTPPSSGPTEESGPSNLPGVTGPAPPSPPAYILPSGAFGVPSGPAEMSEYDKGYADGTVAGNNDGKIDGTEDGMKQGIGLDEDLEATIIDEMMKESQKIDSIIDSNINMLQHNAYCAQVEKAGIQKKLNVRTRFPECNDYFTLMNTPAILEYGEATEVDYGEKGPDYGEKSDYGEGDNETEVEPPAPSTASSIVSAEPDVSGEGAQDGGYREDENGVMQYGGAYNISIAEPQNPYDIGYMEGYKIAYKLAYNLAFTVTKLSLLTTETRRRLGDNSFDYGEGVEVEESEKGPDYGQAESDYGEVEPAGPTKEVSGEPSGEPSGEVSGEPQEGGYLKRLKKAARAKMRLNTGGARMLKRIASKTTGQ